MTKKNSTPRERKKWNAVDIFLITAVVLCLIGGGLRLILGQDGSSLSAQMVMEDYIVSFKITNIRNSSTEYLRPGEKFYMNTTGQYFGEIADSITVTPALYYIEDSEGNYLQTYAPENGDATRIDVTGTMRVSGYMSDNGFLLGGTTALAVNKSFTLQSSYIYVTVTVTDLVKAG